jgi:hypothetical protein
LLAYFASKKVKIMIPLGAAVCMRESPGKRKRSRRDQVGRGEERCPPKCTRPQLNFHLILLAAGLGFYMCTRVFEYNSHMRCLSRKKKPDPARPYQPANTRIHKGPGQNFKQGEKKNCCSTGSESMMKNNGTRGHI